MNYLYTLYWTPEGKPIATVRASNGWDARNDDFVSAYVTCALWSTTDDNGDPLDRQYSDADIADESLTSMREDCARFMEANADDLREAGGDDSQNGHDFWLTRNGHGAGFWSRGYKDKVGERLTEAANAYGTSDLYVGDDGKLYIS